MKEIEIKILLDEEKRNQLLSFLETNNAHIVKEEIQENWYFAAEGDNDLRLRRTDNKAFIILKKGWLHDDDREEYEVEIDQSDFDHMDHIFRSLGYTYDTKWYRHRTEYKHNQFTITLDFNAGYGWVAEIELIVSEGGEERAKVAISELLKEIGLEPTPTKIFDEMYAFYKQHWPHYIESKDTFTYQDVLNNQNN